MKIAIFTWCYRKNYVNYGQMLQCYALQNACKKFGHEVQVMRYRKPENNEGFILHLNQNERITYENERKYDRISMYGIGTIDRCCGFLNKYISFSPQYYSKSEIENNLDEFDVLLVGSDQLWNPIWLDDVNILNFNHSDKTCVSYATGGITSDVSLNELQAIKQIARSIEHFNSVSVRECISKKILNKYIDKEIEDVIDPTLLLETREWDEICCGRLIEEKYIFVMYMGLITPQKHLFKEVKKKHNSYKIIYLNLHRSTESINDEPGMELYENAGPCEFLSLIKYAEAVCTDSFHAFVFSIIYNVPFYLMDRAYIPQSITSNLRWKNLMDRLGIKNRYANSKKEINMIAQNEYDDVNNKIYGLREKDSNWLINSLERG